MKLTAWIVIHKTGDGTTHYVLWQKPEPTLEQALVDIPPFSEAWRGRRPIPPKGEDMAQILANVIQQQTAQLQAAVAGEEPPVIAMPEIQWSAPEDPAHEFQVIGPFDSPQILDTFAVHRPGAQTPMVICHATGKGAAIRTVAQAFGRCPGMTATRMLPRCNRVLAPLR